MSVDLVLGVLGWAFILNYLVLLFWFVIFIYAHDWMYALHRKWFKISPETFDVIHYCAMAFYKLSIFIFLLAPYIALRIVT